MKQQQPWGQGNNKEPLEEGEQEGEGDKNFMSISLMNQSKSSVLSSVQLFQISSSFLEENENEIGNNNLCLF